ncbi:MAG TPA: cadherin-like beta sandwich domain-containing protein, partial [Abditibacteriaceae bacterium]|nr:cadherin-like beta sandwich domain-containing protein [Abditibacteriaceae bacterium]
MKDSPDGTLAGTEASDASLQSIEVDPGNLLPDFWGERTSFAVMLPSTADSINITATTTQPGATARINGEPISSGPPVRPFVLTTGRQVFNIAVTAEDGTTTKTYQVKVLRAAPAPDWVQVLDTAPWAPRDSAGEVVFNERMWIFGGYLPELVSDVWSSSDGKDWNNTGSIPSPAGINVPVNFVHDGRMWVSSNDGKLFASSDGREWTVVTDEAPCLPRYGAGSAVFAGRMWILGGTGSGTAFNDVWSSSDGVRWTQELDAAPWSRRQLFGNVVVHDNKLWVIGGGLTHYQPFKAYRDVWCSTDGREWIEVTGEAPWPARIWSCCIVSRGRLWLLGGFRSQPTWNNFNDVWYSADGAHWQEL